MLPKIITPTTDTPTQSTQALINRVHQIKLADLSLQKTSLDKMAAADFSLDNIVGVALKILFIMQTEAQSHFAEKRTTDLRSNENTLFFTAPGSTENDSLTKHNELEKKLSLNLTLIPAAFRLLEEAFYILHKFNTDPTNNPLFNYTFKNQNTHLIITSQYTAKALNDIAKGELSQLPATIGYFPFGLWERAMNTLLTNACIKESAVKNIQATASAQQQLSKVIQVYLESTHVGPLSLSGEQKENHISASVLNSLHPILGVTDLQLKNAAQTPAQLLVRSKESLHHSMHHKENTSKLPPIPNPIKFTN